MIDLSGVIGSALSEIFGRDTHHHVQRNLDGNFVVSVPGVIEDIRIDGRVIHCCNNPEILCDQLVPILKEAIDRRFAGMDYRDKAKLLSGKGKNMGVPPPLWSYNEVTTTANTVPQNISFTYGPVYEQIADEMKRLKSKPQHPWETPLRTKRLRFVRKGLRRKIARHKAIEFTRKAACVAFMVFWVWGICGRPGLH